ncbi:MAG: nuclear transport factor 2 family protein [Saprospiraceae bacterium]|nr:nuclear transport factor 2 family protein [Saprospiraceae bacterium]
MRMILLFVAGAVISGCASPAPSPEQMEQWENEIRQAEADFAAMAASEGIGAAFAAFAADDAALLRGGTVIEGKTQIAAFYAERDNPDATLTWTPDFVRVSEAGDMAYTYGPYTYSAPDSTGQAVRSTGIFHTVWQRQADGTWKYVWD